MDTLRKRIEYLLKNHRVTPYKVSKETGISQSVFSVIRNDTTNEKTLQSETANKIAEYFKVNPDWLLRGEGEMLLQQEPIEPNAKLYIPSYTTHVMEVPVVPYNARAGVLGEYEQLFADETYEKMLIPKDKVAHGKFLIFIVSGSSMEPILLSDDRVLAELVDSTIWTQGRLPIYKYPIWVIITRDEGILVKNIIDHDSKKGTLLAHSYNTTFPDITIHLEDVVDIYRVSELVYRAL